MDSSIDLLERFNFLPKAFSTPRAGPRADDVQITVIYRTIAL